MKTPNAGIWISLPSSWTTDWVGGDRIKLLDESMQANRLAVLEHGFVVLV